MKIIQSLLLVSLSAAALPVLSWSNHTVVSHTLLSSMPAVSNAQPVKVETIESFLMANEDKLEAFLAHQETQMRTSLWHYAPRPEALAFKATGNQATIRNRFTRAIRINPNVKMPLYLQLLPGDKRDVNAIAPKDVTVFKNFGYLNDVKLVQLAPGDMVAPVDVATSGNDEPDHGLDIGLFNDSKTEYGLEYGFGKQPFGNPNLEYGTQAPFHMGFYHESAVLYSLGAFLKETYPEYRIQLFKQLSEFAFENGHDYWGWRFMGWGMHYIGDFSNPYHITPVPGNSTLDTLLPGVLGIAGFPQSQIDATQLVSNRHTVLEDFQSLVMTQALLEGNHEHQTLKALHIPAEIRVYQDSDVIGVFSEISYGKAVHINDVIDQTMPAHFVSDTSVEYSDLGVAMQLIDIVKKESGEEGFKALLDTISDLLSDFSHNGASYVEGIINNKVVGAHPVSEN
jgi:hypothetical protein